jgi:S1-C subfamily serine protease
LKIRCKPGEKFKAVHFAADDDLLLGETVLALGNPFGLGGSVTKGILSSKSRRPSTGNDPLDVQDWLQTDAAINPGNSGGPLINIRGDLIGLNVAVYREGQGIGFAIPVKQVSEALSGFFTPEVRHSLWFGAQLKVGSSPLTVTDVQPNSPAANAGIVAGDRILQVNGHRVESLIQFDGLVSKASDHKVSLLLEKGEGRTRRTLSLETIPFSDLIRQRSGLTVTDLTKEQANRLGLQDGKGLLITEVAHNSPADRAQLRAGFLITEIDGQGVDAVMNLGLLLSLKEKGSAVRFTIVAPRRLGSGLLEFQQGTVELKLQ